MGVSNITLAPPAKLVVHKASKPSVDKPQLVERTASRGSSSTSATATGPQQTQQFSIADRPARPTATAAVKRRVHFSTAAGGCNSASTATSTEPLTIIVHTIPSSRELDDHDKAQLWWTKEERRDILERNQRMVEDYLRRNAQHVLSLRQVFHDERCSTLPQTSAVVSSDDDTSSSSSLSSSSEDSSSDDDDDEELFSSSRKRGRGRRSPLHKLVHKRQRQLHGSGSSHSQKMSLPTSIRGLEYGILPEAKGHRRLHRKRVLDWQERIKSQWSAEQRVVSTHGNDYDIDDIDAINNVHQNQHHLATVLEQQSIMSSHRSRQLAELLAASDAEEDSSKGFAATATTGSNTMMSGYHYAPTTSTVRRARPRMMW